MLIDRIQIEQMIPHKGTMCLLDGVRSWDPTGIVCVAISHRDLANPLARNGQLSILAGLEYGGQAMAIHGALTCAVGETPKMGVIASARALRWEVDRLDNIAEQLDIEARLLSGDGAQVSYEIRLSALGHTLLSGRVIALLQTEMP